MKNEFNGIERRLDELSERLARLAPLRQKSLNDIQADPYLADIIERNLEMAIQCCLDICHRIISLEEAAKARDYYESFIRLGELEILPLNFAKKLAPLAGLRNILVHEYLQIDWQIILSLLKQLEDFDAFSQYIKKWLRSKNKN